MRKILKPGFLALAVLAVLSSLACSPVATKKVTASDVIAHLKASGLPIGATVIYTAETEPNKLLGRPNQYTEKAAWKDDRIKLNGDPGTDTGGTVEIFANETDRQTRQTYVQAIAKQPIFAEYSYANGSVLIRLSKELTPDQAAGYESALKALKS